jgi:nicotinamidase-related amidase
MIKEISDNSLLLIIDPEYDFVDKSGKLYVEGAEIAIENISQFITKNIDCFKDIVITQDTHQRFHISSQFFWDDKVKPGTVITKDDIKSSKYIPIATSDEIDYNLMFEGIDKYGPITIWPSHCLEGTMGQSIPLKLMREVNNWGVRNRRSYIVQKKGDIPVLESFSALTEEVIFGIKPYWRNRNYDKVYVCGFCKDYCVAYTVSDMIKTGDYEGKLVFVEPCMSSITKNSEMLKIYDEAIEKHGASKITKI